jgi:hypothetical protein
LFFLLCGHAHKTLAVLEPPAATLANMLPTK